MTPNRPFSPKGGRPPSRDNRGGGGGDRKPYGPPRDRGPRPDRPAGGGYGSSSDRPPRPYGPPRDRGPRPDRPAGGGYGSSSDRPPRPYGPPRDRGPRPDRPAGGGYGSSSDRPPRPYGPPRDRGPRPDRPFNPSGPPRDREGGRPYEGRSDRPPRPFGPPRDRGPRPDRPFNPSGPPRDREGGSSYEGRSDRPPRPFGPPRDRGPRPDRPFNPSGPPRDREGGSSYEGRSDRPPRPFGPPRDRGARPENAPWDEDRRKPRRTFGPPKDVPNYGEKPRFMPEERASSPDRPPRKPFGPDFKRPRTRRPDGPEAPRFEDRPRREKLVHREIRTDFGESRPPRRDEEERPRYTPAARTVRPGEFELYGRKPVYEVLKLGLVRSLEVTQRAHGKIIDDILALAAEQDVPVSRADFFEDEEGFAVQGVRASAVPPEVRQDLRHFVKELPEQPAPLILMLDGITDPHNFGAILRTAAAAKVTAVVIRERRQAPINDVVVKASAGAAYFIPIFQVVNLGQVIRMLEEENYWTVVATSGENTSDYTSYHWETKTLLIVGGEGSGVSDLLDRTVKDRISISMSGMVESLNVSVATGIILFEALKRRETV